MTPEIRNQMIERQIETVVFVNGKQSLDELEQEYLHHRKILLGNVKVFSIYLRLESYIEDGDSIAQIVDDNEYGSQWYGQVIFSKTETSQKRKGLLRDHLLWAFDRYHWLLDSLNRLENLGYVIDSSWKMERDSGGLYWMELCIKDNRISLSKIDKGHRSGAILDFSPLAEGDIFDTVVPFEKQWMTLDSLSYMNGVLRHEISTREDLPMRLEFLNIRGSHEQ